MILQERPRRDLRGDQGTGWVVLYRSYKCLANHQWHLLYHSNDRGYSAILPPFYCHISYSSISVPCYRLCSAFVISLSDGLSHHRSNPSWSFRCPCLKRSFLSLIIDMMVPNPFVFFFCCRWPLLSQTMDLMVPSDVTGVRPTCVLSWHL